MKKDLRIAVPFEWKALDSEGQFEGYASVFGNVDEGGDVVTPGAFIGDLNEQKRTGAMTMLLFNHDPDKPLGRLTDIAEDAKGLYVKGELALNVGYVRDVYELLKAKAMRGMSFGFSVIDADFDKGRRLLKKLKLWEVSIVSFPMNQRAKVEAVKNIDPIGERLEEFCKSVRDGELPAPSILEAILRDAGLSKAVATAVVSVGYTKSVRSESEGKSNGEGKAIVSGLREALAGFK